MSDKSYVTMEQAVCPACGTKHDTGNLLLDKRLKNRFEQHTVTHWDFCPEHQKMIEDGFVILVGIDKSKSKGTKPEEVYRTGDIVAVRKAVAKQMLPSMGDSPLAWCEPDVVQHLITLAKQANAQKN